MTTTSTPARASMPGYLVSRRHRLSRLSSSSEPFWLKTMSGSAYSGSVASSLSTPSWSSWGMPAKGRPEAAEACAPPGPPPKPPPPPPPNIMTDPRRGPNRAGPAAAGRRAPRPVVGTRCRSSAASSASASSSNSAGLGQHLGVERCGLEQLGVGPVGHDLVLVQQDHPVGQGDGGQPVGDDQGGPALHLDPQSGMDPLLHLDVDGAGGVVEHHDGRVDQQGPGDGDPLPLAAGEGVAPLADHRVVAVGQVGDELVGAGRLGRGLDLVEGGRRLAVGDVVAHRHGEQEGLVEHHADVGPQAGQGQIPHVVAVDLGPIRA